MWINQTVLHFLEVLEKRKNRHLIIIGRIITDLMETLIEEKLDHVAVEIMNARHSKGMTRHGAYLVISVETKNRQIQIGMYPSNIYTFVTCSFLHCFENIITKTTNKQNQN